MAVFHISDGDSCTGTDAEKQLNTPDGNLVQPYPAHPHAPPPPWEAHAELPQWKERARDDD